MRSSCRPVSLVFLFLLVLVSGAAARAEFVKEGDLPEFPAPAEIYEPSEAPELSPEVQHILELADEQLGSVDYGARDKDGPKGWKYLQDLFTEMTGMRPRTEELQTNWTPNGKSWCGIWAFRIWREALRQDLRWNLSTGRPNGDFMIFAQWNFRSRSKFESLVRPGDIFAIAHRSHHGIVESVQGDRMVTLEANRTLGRIERVTTRRLSEIVTFYRPRF